MAADKFTTAANLVDQLVASASGAGATQILQGGSLGQQVPDRIAAAEQTARTCQQAILDAAETCLERVAIIEDYETRLEAYDVAYVDFDARTRAWAAQFNAWFLDETGTIAQPANLPHPPNRPEPPPAWAEVRRL